MRRSLLAVGLLVLVAHGALAEEAPANRTAEARVRELYDMISVEPGGNLPDWTKVRALFLDEAVIFMRTSREATATMTVSQWVEDFRSFIDKANVRERGFTETIVRLHATEFREIAEVTVLYEASFPTSVRPPQQGVDMIHLARIDGEWRIVSIVNDVPESPEQIPPALRD
jgi:hypothetical protein